MNHYENVLPEIRHDDLHYVPLIVSCFGRIHCENSATMNKIASVAARKVGISNVDNLIHRTIEKIGVVFAAFINPKH